MNARGSVSRCALKPRFIGELHVAIQLKWAAGNREAGAFIQKHDEVRISINRYT